MMSTKDGIRHSYHFYLQILHKYVLSLVFKLANQMAPPMSYKNAHRMVILYKLFENGPNVPIQETAK